MGGTMSNLFNKITLRSHYRQEYNDLLSELIQSSYAPKVWTKKITVKDKNITTNGPLIIIANSVVFGKSILTLNSSSLVVVRKVKNSSNPPHLTL